MKRTEINAKLATYRDIVNSVARTNAAEAAAKEAQRIAEEAQRTAEEAQRTAEEAQRIAATAEAKLRQVTQSHLAEQTQLQT